MKSDFGPDFDPDFDFDIQKKRIFIQNYSDIFFSVIPAKERHPGLRSGTRIQELLPPKESEAFLWIARQAGFRFNRMIWAGQ
jgi:hypothetical protein